MSYEQTATFCIKYALCCKTKAESGPKNCVTVFLKFQSKNLWMLLDRHLTSGSRNLFSCLMPFCNCVTFWSRWANTDGLLKDSSLNQFHVHRWKRYSRGKAWCGGVPDLSQCYFALIGSNGLDTSCHFCREHVLVPCQACDTLLGKGPEV